jgi:hypothetical protein
MRRNLVIAAAAFALGAGAAQEVLAQDLAALIAYLRTLAPLPEPQ